MVRLTRLDWLYAVVGRATRAPGGGTPCVFREAGMISRIDHFVLTVHSVEATCAFYERVLGFQRVDAQDQPTALTFGQQKIHVHEVGRTFEPKAKTPTPGAGDFCLITDGSLNAMMSHLEAHHVTIEVGPIKRTGAQGVMTSVYFRDPDGNLVEVSEYDG